MQVEFDRHSLKIDGARRLIRSGSLHYFRLPDPGLWADRLQKMKAAGLNAVDLYYPWNYHCEHPGEYDFEGIRDLDRLHDLIEEAGLWLIARPGPYICAEVDMGGLPAWLFRGRGVIPRCRSQFGFAYSRDFMDATGEWYSRVIPSFASRSNLILVQVENEYTVPAPLSDVPNDLLDLLIRWFGTGGMHALARVRRPWVRRRLRKAGSRGQTSPYMRELCDLARRYGVEVPIFHNDLSSSRGRQMDVDMLSVDRYPVTDFTRDWRDDPATFDVFRRDEASLDAHGRDNPLFYPELQGGWYDAWGGPGYERIREQLGPSGIDNATKAALAARATLWNYYVFCGGVTWGYMGSPDVYSSYDYGAPIPESGRPGARYEAVRSLNQFLDTFEADLAHTDVEDTPAWCPQHLVTRRGPKRRYVFLRNPSREPIQVPTPESERSELAAWETQVRVYAEDGALESVSPPPLCWNPPPEPGLGVELPRLERWTFSNSSPQLDPSYDDSAWIEIPRENLERDAIDIDSLGVHYGFIWYRGSFSGPLDRLLLDARHSWAVWIDGRLVAMGDQFRNTLGVGPDGARKQRIPLGSVAMNEGRNCIVVLVESLGHNKGFSDDFTNPRGIVRLETGSTPISWRFRGGLLRGERGMTPVVAFEGVERGQATEVELPHAWNGESGGVGLYETSFELHADPQQGAIAAVFDPGRGKANLYLNGYLLGRYWPERGPQQRFILPWGVLRPGEENHLAVALWKRSSESALGRIRLEVV